MRAGRSFDSLTISDVSESWVEEYLARNPTATPHATVEGDVILTGSAEEVRAFVGRHLETEDAFERIGSYVRCADTAPSD